MWTPSGYSPPGSTRITSLPRAPWCRSFLNAPRQHHSATFLLIMSPTCLIWFYKVINIWAPQSWGGPLRGVRLDWDRTPHNFSLQGEKCFVADAHSDLLMIWRGGEELRGIRSGSWNPSLMCLFNQGSRIQSQSPEQAVISCTLILSFEFRIIRPSAILLKEKLEKHTISQISESAFFPDPH